jgi:hypothetical protein
MTLFSADIPAPAGAWRVGLGPNMLVEIDALAVLP